MVILNTCHIREKAAEKVFSELGRLRRLKRARAAAGGRHDHRRRRLRRAGRGRGDPGARAVCRYRARAADLSPPARDGGARARGAGGARHRHRLSGRGQVRLTCRDAAAPQGVTRVPHGAGRLRQVLHLLRRALYARRRILAAGRPTSIAEARRLVARGAREITLLGQNVNAYHGAGARTAATWGLGAADPRAGRDRRARAPPLHDLASARHGRRPDRRASRRAAADAVPASAGAVGLRPRPRGDEPQAHAPTTICASSSGCARRGPISRCRRISSSAFPARREADFAGDAATGATRSASPRPFRSNTAPRPGTPAASMRAAGAGGGEGRAAGALQALLRAPAGRPSMPRCVGRTLPVLFERPGRHAGQLVGRSPYLQPVHVDGAAA